MEWNSNLLYNKAKLYAERAHEEAVDSALFGLWMSLALELLARASLSKIHPVLLADPREQDNIYYAFGIIPPKPPKSIPAKTIFARCSVFVPGFTDKMSAHCLIVSDRRNSELHSGTAAFENIDNAKWLPSTYEVMEVLLAHLGRDFDDYLGEHGAVAVETLRDRKDNIKNEVQNKLSAARKLYQAVSADDRTAATSAAELTTTAWLKESRHWLKSSCPACENPAVISGEIVGRSPVRIDEHDGTISREVRVLPNKLHCAFCNLVLSSFQELKEAERGTIYTRYEEEDPIAFFGIDPEDHVDIEKLMNRYAEDMYDYGNE